MKLTIDAVLNPKDSDNNDLTVTCRDKAGREHTVIFTDRAQQDLFAVLVGSAPGPHRSTPRRSLIPIGIQVSHTSHMRLGLRVFLQQDLAIHFSCEKVLVELLQQLLAAFEWPDVTKQ